MSRLFAVAVFFFSLALCAFAQNPRFSGVWSYDPARSIALQAKPVGLLLTVVADNEQVRVTRSPDPMNPDIDERYVCSLDGKPCRSVRNGAPVSWSLHVDGSALAWSAERTLEPGSSVKWTERWSLSTDANTLTIDRAYGAVLSQGRTLSPEVGRTHPEMGRVREVFTRQKAPGR